MRSLIILEVEHGDTTYDVEYLASRLGEFVSLNSTATLNDYSVRVDLPACFVLD